MFHIRLGVGVGACGRGWGHVTRARGIWQGGRDMWQDVEAYGRGDGMWQGVGSCGRVWGHIAGGWGM